jgi:hypothetical protein
MSDPYGRVKSGLNQTATYGVANQPGGFVYVQLLHDVGSMGFNRVGADIEDTSYIFGGLALGH